jgi:hypothetical protein
MEGELDPLPGTLRGVPQVRESSKKGERKTVITLE